MQFKDAEIELFKPFIFFKITDFLEISPEKRLPIIAREKNKY